MGGWVRVDYQFIFSRHILHHYSDATSHFLTREIVLSGIFCVHRFIVNKQFARSTRWCYGRISVYVRYQVVRALLFAIGLFSF